MNDRRDDLGGLRPDDGSRVLSQLEQLSPHERGRAFEKELLRLLGMGRGVDLVHLSYRPKGEEIDGAFWLNGRTFLVEAKWIKRPVSASSIYAFKGKVDGKLEGTLGVFVSMSGYSPECVNAVRYGKAQRIVLFDRSDVEALVFGDCGFSEMLRDKLYCAGRTGEIYLPWSSLFRVREAGAASDRERHTVLLVEGPTQRRLVEEVVRRFAGGRVAEQIEYVHADGATSLARYALPGLGKVFAINAEGAGEVIVVLDGKRDDRDVPWHNLVEEALLALPAGWQPHVVTARPSLKAWLFSTDERIEGRDEFLRLLGAAVETSGTSRRPLDSNA